MFWKRKPKRVKVKQRVKISSVKLNKKYTVGDTYVFNYVPAANAYKYIYSNIKLANKSLDDEEQLMINFLSSEDDMNITFEISGYASTIDRVFNMLVAKDINLIRCFKIRR